MLQRGEIEFDIGEGLGRGEEGDFGAALAVGVADHLERRHRIAMGELDEMFLAVAPDAQVQLLDSALTTETPTPCRPPDTL